MKHIVLFFILFVFSNHLRGLNSLEWKSIQIEPDIIVYFPDEPQKSISDSIIAYEWSSDTIIYKVTSEESPLNYYGRTIKEVNNEFYSQLTSQLITSKQRLISERDFEFENHHVRELIYEDSIKSKLVTVQLQILNVTGISKAMYKFYKINLSNSKGISKDDPFFSGWNLYGSFEGNFNTKEDIESLFLKDKLTISSSNYLVPLAIPLIILLIAILLSIIIINNLKFSYYKTLGVIDKLVAIF